MNNKGIFEQPDKWDMVNVSGVTHEDVRIYLRSIFSGKKALEAAKEEEMIRERENGSIYVTSSLCSSGIASMWYNSGSNALLYDVVDYRLENKKALVFFLMHRRARYCGQMGIYQRRQTTGRNTGGALVPFFLFVPPISPNEKIPIARILQPPRRPVPLANPAHTLKTWWTCYTEWPYAYNAQFIENTLKVLAPHIPAVPYIHEGAYFKAVRHNGFLQNVIRQLQCLVRLYSALNTTSQIVAWPEMRLKYHVGRTPTRYNGEAFRANIEQNQSRRINEVAMYEKMKRDVVIQTSDLLDATADGIPDMYKHDHPEKT